MIATTFITYCSVFFSLYNELYRLYTLYEVQVDTDARYNINHCVNCMESTTTHVIWKAPEFKFFTQKRQTVFPNSFIFPLSEIWNAWDFHFQRILKLTFHDFEKRTSKTPRFAKVNKKRKRTYTVRMPSNGYNFIFGFKSLCICKEWAKPTIYWFIELGINSSLSTINRQLMFLWVTAYYEWLLVWHKHYSCSKQQSR